MIVLDTDHVRVLQLGGSRTTALESRLLAASDPDIVTTIATAHEVLKGWQDQMSRARSTAQVIQQYEYLRRILLFFGRWRVLPLDEAAGTELERLQKLRLRSINTLDLRIAAITLSRSTMLLSGDGHFQLVPDLPVQDWRPT